MEYEYYTWDCQLALIAVNVMNFRVINVFTKGLLHLRLSLTSNHSERKKVKIMRKFRVINVFT